MNKQSKIIKVSKGVKKLTNNKTWFLFFVILSIGMYLRFYGIEKIMGFGWDQGRDAWIVRDIIMGKYTLIGPRTGIGHFNLGPVYFYFLAPFYYLTNLDPMASNYFNIISNIFNFFVLFVVTKKLFNNYAALFVTFIYAVNRYVIGINQVPWNVTLMPGVALLIFYAIIKIYEKEYKWVYILSFLSGFYFHLHFTAVFLPFIIIASLIFVKDKLRVLKHAIYSLPFYLIWFVPNIIYELQNHNANYFRFREFLGYYYHGFHLRFLLHRLPDSLIHFSTILNYPKAIPLKFIIPAIFVIVWLFEKDRKYRLLGYLLILWFVIPLIGFTLYSGPLSEYYFLFNLPMVLYILLYLHIKLFRNKLRMIIPAIIIFWVLYTYSNTKGLWIKNDQQGLWMQKNDVRDKLQRGEKIEYKEGDIKSYLYTIWDEEKRK